MSASHPLDELCSRILHHDFALLHHGSRTFVKCLLCIRLTNCVCVYHNITGLDYKWPNHLKIKEVIYVETVRTHKIKEPGSAITHFIGMFMAAAAAAPLIIKAVGSIDKGHITASVIFIVSMILLYGASTTYHTFDISEKVNKVLKKLDHAMIFVLIAGTYTPVCVMGLNNAMGYWLLTTIWTIAALGITFKMVWVTCPKWVSSVMYIIMGWLCMIAAPFFIRNAGTSAFAWLLAGGIIYTIGGIIYALKGTGFNKKHKNFGTHEIFHLFCLGGSFCHFMLVYLYLV